MAYTIWFVLSVIIGVLAHTRGRNIIGWTLLSMVISPLIAGIVVMILSNPKEEQARREREMDEELDMMRESQRRAESAPKEPSLAGPDVVLSFVQLRQLLDKGVLNPDEYAGRKGQLLEQLKTVKLKDTPENVLALVVPLAENGTISDDDLHAIKSIVLRA